jgi:TRAP-type transport system periplasmic protein
MRNPALRRRGRSSLLAALLAFVLLFAAACGADEDAAPPPDEEEAPAVEEPEQVTLRALTFLPLDNPNVGPVFPIWAELVEEATNGRVRIENAGGPESVPTEEQLAAVRRGVADVTFNVSSFTAHEVPAAHLMILSPFTPAEERENGFFDFIDRVHQEAGVRYLGRFLSVNPFYIWTNDPIERLDDLRGMRLRSAPAFHHVVQGVQAEAVNLVPGEIFTALERGVIEGFVWPLIGPRETGWIDVTRNVVNAPFYNQNGAILINPDAWEQLGPELQEQVLEATARFEERMVETYLEIVNGEREQAEQAGVGFVELPDEDRDQFHRIWYEASWEAFGQAARS